MPPLTQAAPASQTASQARGGLLLLIDEVDGLAQLVKEELPSKGKNRISDSDQLLAVMVEAGIWLEHRKGAEKVKYLEYFIAHRLKELARRGATRATNVTRRWR